MRRLVDSLILVLVAYTVIAPLARGLIGAPRADDPEIEPRSHWSVVGESEAGAELQLRLDLEDGPSREFEVVCDDHGQFEVLMYGPLPAEARLVVCDGKGVTLAQTAVSGSRDTGVVDLGALRAN